MAAIAGDLGATLAIAGVWYYFSPWYTDVGYRPVQPVPYSHKLHVVELGLDGKGILFQRGTVPTASFHQDQILTYPGGQLFDVITNGTGARCGYRWPIPPADTWAIAASVRELERKRLAGVRGASAGID